MASFLGEGDEQAQIQLSSGGVMGLYAHPDGGLQMLQAMLMQMPEVEERSIAQVELTVTVVIEAPLPAFYLSGPSSQPRVPSAGLYYYHADYVGLLREYVIGFDGLPRPTGKLVSMERMRPVWGGCTEPCWAHSWAVKVPDMQDAYLANVSLGRGEILDTCLDERWLVPEPCDGGAAYSLGPELRATLSNMLFRRYQQGYQAVSEWAKADNPRYHEVNLRSNAARFWETCKAVNMGLIRRLSEDFRRDLDGQEEREEREERAPHFVNPDLVFQLSRHLSEGFIEGHARAGVPISGGYAVPEESTRAWRTAIDRARRSPGAVNYRSLDRQEQEIYDLICRQFRPVSWALWWRPDAMMWWSLTGLLGFVTAGRKVEDIVFWAMHYPHWFADLVFALRELAGADGTGPKLCVQDAQVIAQVIMEAYVETNDNPLTAWADQFALEFGRLIVGRILSALNERAGQAPLL